MPRPVSQKVVVSVVYVVAMFMTIMDTTIVNVALPTISQASAGYPVTNLIHSVPSSCDEPAQKSRKGGWPDWPSPPAGAGG
jgi:hypothetical protein